MKIKNKILHINSYFNGGSFYKNLYDAQVESGLEIDVFVSVYEVYKNNNCDFGEYTIISHNHKKWHRFLFYYKQKLMIRDALKQYNITDYSLIHAHSLFTNGNVAYHMKKKYNIPYIVAVRNTDINTFFKRMPFLRKRGIEILKNATYVVFLSSSYRDLLIKKYIPQRLRKSIIEKSVVIPNGIDSYWHLHNNQPKQLKNINKINILGVGVINKNKNQVTTIKAIEALNKQGYEIFGTFVGRVVNQHVHNIIINSDLCTHIAPTAKEKLIGIYRSNDILVVPSITETFGLVYPEAMSQGLPVVYSRNQGFDDVFEDGQVGYSVDSLNMEDIVKAILLIIENYNQISKNAVYGSKKFKWREIANEYNELYKNVIKDD